MNTESKLARLSGSSGPARFLTPAGIVLTMFAVSETGRAFAE